MSSHKLNVSWRKHIINNKLRKFIEFSVNVIVDKLIIWPFYYSTFFFMRKVCSNNDVKQNGIALLALNSGRFRGDLEALADLGFIVYMMPYSWQTRIFYAYKDRGCSKDEFLNPKVGAKIYNDRIRVRRYLSKLLGLLIQKRKINCVISAGIFYNQDFDWGAVAKNIGTPYVVFHRENLLISRHLYAHHIERAELLKKIGFVGTSIVFQNKAMKGIFDKYSGVKPEYIFALGSLRMDKYINKINKNINKINKNINKINKNINFEGGNRVTLFSFPSSDAILSGYSDDFGWFDLHDQVHESFVELARENPGINFIIKHKDVNWSRTEKLLKDLEVDNISNLQIYNLSFDAQEIILASNVIVGFCSTSLLEAAIANKPIIYPLFAEAAEKSYENVVCFDNASDIFDIATNREEFKKIIIERYNNPSISAEMKERRASLFENQVSSMSADSAIRYSEYLKRICN